jgi:thiamine biosynthesis protein ThiS
MNIYLNGEPREVPENLTLGALLDWLKLPTDRVAVERNREIAPRSTWAQAVVCAGDRLEVVHFVGGGAFDFTVPRARGIAGYVSHEVLSLHQAGPPSARGHKNTP